MLASTEASTDDPLSGWWLWPTIEPAHEVEEQLPAGLGEGQVAELVEDDEVAAYLVWNRREG